MFKSLGKLFLVKPETLSTEEKEFFRDLSFENFIFFREHFEGDFKDYLSTLKGALKELKLLSVDQEGGRVTRLQGNFESPFEVAKRARLEGFSPVKEWALKLARALKEQGLNLNLAPVVDRGDHHAPSFLRERTFGLNPEEIVACSEVFISLHQGLGLKTCLKHFPGLFGVLPDPHQELPLKEELLEEDLIPFKRLASKADFIMTTHLLLPQLDTRPVTFSERVISFLRKEINFRGAILTDDLAMGALKAFELSERVLYALLSGHNLLIYCGKIEELRKALEEIRREVEKSRTLKEKIKTSLTILEKY